MKRRPNIPKISEAEWQVMEVFWKKSPLRSGQVVQVLGQHPKTVKTYIARLVKKGALGCCKDGHLYWYRPLLDKATCQAAESRHFLAKVFGGSLQPMLTHFIEHSSLSSSDVDELKRFLEKRRK